MDKYLSNIELYFTPPKNISKENILIEGDEFLHIIKVMRHKVDDELFVTDGTGKIYQGKIIIIGKSQLIIKNDKIFSYQNKYENLYFCIPKLKSSDRFEFALEKSTELGITNFIVFESHRTISKIKKVERWNKILLSSMKQSLRSFLPTLEIINNLKDISQLEGNKIIFEQNSNNYFDVDNLNLKEKSYFIFGPEGGLTKDELESFNTSNIYKLAENRLRTETAIIKCASIL